MKTFADQLLASMIAHEPYSLPLAPRYKATENGVPGALNMMSSWRIIQDLNKMGQLIEDPERGILFFTANVKVSNLPSLFWARLQITDGLITELEMFLCHSRGEGGFVHNPDQIGNLPKGWIEPLPETGVATRAELEHLAEAIFNSSLEGPPPADYSILMEQGGVVHEDPDYLSLLASGEMSELPVGSDEETMSGMGLFPFRPHSDFARVIAVDETQGIAVSAATVWGYVSEHVTRRSGAQSAFVPDAMMENHLKTIVPEWMEGLSVMTQMRAACISFQMFRLHSGVIQGMQMLNYVVPVAGDAVWSTDPAGK